MSLSYTLDVWYNKVKAQQSYAAFLVYIANFHHLVAGPIIRYGHIAKEITERYFRWEDFHYGVNRFSKGLFKKVCIANTAGTLAIPLLNGDINSLSIVGAWLSIILFSLQIYFDFSGYSDMAIGLGKMFGFHYHENFKHPYIAKSISDFWRRWHISLSSFFKDYVYIPLGGNKHNQVDDYPFGGGQGMVLKPEPIFNAVESLDKTDKTRIILLCPQGERFSQKKAEELSEEEHLIFICGHYEGYDERIREYLVTDELSIGDFILTGGEFAAMTMVDSIARLVPDVLGKEESHKDDSFSTGLLEYPQYTRPKDYKGMIVPDVLTSGHHKNIETYRKKESLRRTLTRRPDLLENYELSKEETKLLDEIKKELKN